MQSKQIIEKVVVTLFAMLLSVPVIAAFNTTHHKPVPVCAELDSDVSYSQAQKRFYNCQAQKGGEFFFQPHLHSFKLFDFTHEGADAFARWQALLDQRERFCNPDTRLQPYGFYADAVQDFCYLTKAFDYLSAKSDDLLSSWDGKYFNWPMFEVFNPSEANETHTNNDIYYRATFNAPRAPIVGHVPYSALFNVYLYYCVKENAEELVMAKNIIVEDEPQNAEFLHVLPCFKYMDDDRKNTSVWNLMPPASQVLAEIFELHLAHLEHQLAVFREINKEETKHMTGIPHEQCGHRVQVSGGHTICLLPQHYSVRDYKLSGYAVCAIPGTGQYTIVKEGDRTKYAHCSELSPNNISRQLDKKRAQRVLRIGNEKLASNKAKKKPVILKVHF